MLLLHANIMGCIPDGENLFEMHFDTVTNRAYHSFYACLIAAHAGRRAKDLQGFTERNLGESQTTPRMHECCHACKIDLAKGL